MLALQAAWYVCLPGPGAMLRRLSIAPTALSHPLVRSAYAGLWLRILPNRLSYIWYRSVKNTAGSRWWWHNHFRRLKAAYVWLHDQYVLTIHVRRLTSGEQYIWLSRLASEANSRSDAMQWGASDWSLVRRKRGPLIAWAAERGCMQAWRKFRPPLPHEKPEPHSTDVRVCVGLVGLNSAVSRRLILLDSLVDDDARLVTRYSVNELNGFAPWMAELARVKPMAVKEELAACIDGEWKLPATRGHVHEVLADLQWHGEGITPLVVPSVIELLEANDPPNVSILEQALRVLLRYGHDQAARIAALAAQRVPTYGDDTRHFVLWLATWLDVDAEPAIEFLRAKLADCEDPVNLMVRICGELRGERAGGVSGTHCASYLRPRALRTLIPLVHIYVNRDTDIDRIGGGVYSPGDRDHAQEFRDSLLTILTNNDGDESEHFLVELADDIAMARSREWILHLLEERRSRLADGQHWSGSDVRAFVRDFELHPRNESDLFGIALRRLSDVKDRLELSDESPRRELRDGDRETEFRSWLARKLGEISRNQYTIPEEEEIPLGRPDLRFERPGMGPVSVELKWAHRWNTAQLVERLENQLVGQYMRATNARFGIYVIGRIRSRQLWRHDGIDRSFDQLLAFLQHRADQILAERPGILGLRVLGLDFVDPRANTVSV